MNPGTRSVPTCRPRAAPAGRPRGPRRPSGPPGSRPTGRTPGEPEPFFANRAPGEGRPVGAGWPEPRPGTAGARRRVRSAARTTRTRPSARPRRARCLRLAARRPARAASACRRLGTSRRRARPTGRSSRNPGCYTDPSPSGRESAKGSNKAAGGSATTARCATARWERGRRTRSWGPAAPPPPPMFWRTRVRTRLRAEPGSTRSSPRRRPPCRRRTRCPSGWTTARSRR